MYTEVAISWVMMGCKSIWSFFGDENLLKCLVQSLLVRVVAEIDTLPLYQFMPGSENIGCQTKDKFCSSNCCLLILTEIGGVQTWHNSIGTVVRRNNERGATDTAKERT